jgi:hypothetical protein
MVVLKGVHDFLVHLFFDRPFDILKSSSILRIDGLVPLARSFRNVFRFTFKLIHDVKEILKGSASFCRQVKPNATFRTSVGKR